MTDEALAGVDALSKQVAEMLARIAAAERARAEPKPRDLLNVTASIVGIGLVILLGFVTWALIYHAIPEDNQTAFNLLIGILSTNVGLVVGFFFGSSMANRKQQDISTSQAATIATQASAIQATAVQAASQTTGAVSGITDANNPAVVTTTTTKVTGDTT